MSIIVFWKGRHIAGPNQRTSEMTRNKALRLLTLLVSLFIAAAPIMLASGAAMADVSPPLGMYLGYIVWASLTLLIGNIFIVLWGTRQANPPPLNQVA
jgi:hypothetical protein